MRTGKCSLVCAFAAASILCGAHRADAAVVDVDVELSLLVDVSGSVDANEFIIQREGYSNAFRYPEVINDILHGGPNGAVAVNMIYWSGDDPDPNIGAREVIPWRILASAQDIADFADLIDATLRPTDLGTHTNIAGAIDFAWPLFGANGFEAPQKIIDVSGDGIENVWWFGETETQAARDRALAAGINAINGLVIKDPSVHDDVTKFYEDAVIGGGVLNVPAFVITVDTREEFGDGLLRKLDLEFPHVDVIPEPASILVWSLLGMLAMAVWQRRKR